MTHSSIFVFKLHGRESNVLRPTRVRLYVCYSANCGIEIGSSYVFGKIIVRFEIIEPLANNDAATSDRVRNRVFGDCGS